MKMKRYLSLLLAGTLALALTACGGSAKTDPGTSDQPSASDENWTPQGKCYHDRILQGGFRNR